MRSMSVPSQLVGPAGPRIPLSQCFKAPTGRRLNHCRYLPRRIVSRSVLVPAIGEQQSHEVHLESGQSPVETQDIPAPTEELTPEEEEEQRTKELYAELQEEIDKQNFYIGRGQKIWGMIITLEKEQALVDIGDKMPAILTRDEYAATWIPKRLSNVTYVGMQRFFRVIGRYRPGPRRVSLAAVETRLFQQRLQQIMEHHATVVGEVTEVNKGGILVDIDGLNAFCPATQIALKPNQLPSLVGKKMRFKVTALDQGTFTCLLSQVRVLNEGPLPGLKVGDVVEGRVLHVRNFGVVVLIGEQAGLLSWPQVLPDRRLDSGNDLKPDERVRVRITAHDPAQGLVYLSMLTATHGGPIPLSAGDNPQELKPTWDLPRRRSIMALQEQDLYGMEDVDLEDEDEEEEEEEEEEEVGAMTSYGGDVPDVPVPDTDKVVVGESDGKWTWRAALAPYLPEQKTAEEDEEEEGDDEFDERLREEAERSIRRLNRKFPSEDKDYLLTRRVLR